MAGLYIHIPFCHSKCAYCDFFSTPHHTKVSDYVDALIAELSLRKTELSEVIDTIYIGGGTPSILTINDLNRLVNAIPHGHLLEFTIEANPEDVTPQWVDSILNLGINRVSIGIQSFIDAELEIVNRRHNAECAEQALLTLNRCGVAEISGDLIYGLPGQTIDSWQYSLDKIIQFELTHLSAYTLSYEPGTKLYAQLQSGKIKECEETDIEAMYQYLMIATRNAGYEHYEISNFAKPGHRAIHNSGYWKYTQYLGLGVSAHSFDGRLRRVNPIGINNYIESIRQGKTYYKIEYETEPELYNDYIITALRTVDGLNIEKLYLTFGEKWSDFFLKSASPHIHSGKLICDDDIYRIEESSWLLSDAVLRDLIYVD